MKTRQYWVIGTCLLVAAITGWMLNTASSVPQQAEPVAKNTPPKDFDQKKETNKTLSQKDAAAETKVPHLVVPQDNLSLLYIVKCSSCHGRDGKGPVGPSIAGKNFDENIAAVRKYKAGQVENTMMKDLLTRTDDKDLEMLAREVSTFK